MRLEGGWDLIGAVNGPWTPTSRVLSVLNEAYAAAIGLLSLNVAHVTAS